MENVVIYYTKPTGFFDIRTHIEYWRLYNVDIFEQVITR